MGDVGAYGTIGVIWLKKTFFCILISQLWSLLALLDTVIHVCTHSLLLEYRDIIL